MHNNYENILALGSNDPVLQEYDTVTSNACGPKPSIFTSTWSIPQRNVASSLGGEFRQEPLIKSINNSNTLTDKLASNHSTINFDADDSFFSRSQLYSFFTRHQ